MYVYSYFAGWCNGSTSRSEREAAGSNPDPATKTDWPPLFDVAKGGGEVNKKCRCFFKRFAALLAALMLCASLSFPCFASNNASTKKWVVAAESQMTNEQGTLSRYLKLTPYVGGNIYAATFGSSGSPSKSVPSSSDSNTISQFYWVNPYNYPDWWRSSIPLGNYSYVQFDKVRVLSCFLDGVSSSNLSDVSFVPLNTAYSLDFSSDYQVSVDHNQPFSLSSASAFYPVCATFYYTNVGSSSSVGTTAVNASIFSVPLSSSSPSVFNLSLGTQVVPTTVPFVSSSVPLPFSGIYWAPIPAFSNISSDSLVWAVLPRNYVYDSHSFDLRVSAEISFWIDANKLPAGLKVGDEFPADTDAFDNLRDELIKQFPEASENIENGKDTIQGWNDTVTVDTDVASTSISALNALFQNLGGFLFIVSLMVFGAVVLRMLIRKAVDG